MQTLFDQQGEERSVLSLIVREALRSGVEDIGIVVWPGDEEPYAELLADEVAELTFLPQCQPRGYADAVFCAREFVGDQPFLHCVGDHIYDISSPGSGAHRLVEVAKAEECAVSSVQISRESALPHYGVVGGQRIVGKPDIYRIDTVLEKPTPTQAEQQLIVPGLRSGQYLCFHGMHVLTPTIFSILDDLLHQRENEGVSLSTALAELARREQYLALVQKSRRYDVGVKYGLFHAQLALALSGQDRDEVLTELVNTLAQRTTKAEDGATR